MKTKVGFLSLGCPKNEVDCEIMLARVAAAGYELVADDTQADVMIVNTCAFINSAKEEGIESILDLAWLKENKNLKGIVVTGCMAQRYMTELQKSLPEVDAALSLAEQRHICEAVEKAAKGEKFFLHSAPDGLELEGDRILTHEHFAYLRVAEGCSNRCTFCAIPEIRGPFRSRPMENILAEAKTLSDAGVKEIILIAQDTTRYGIDLYGRYALAELCGKLCDPAFGFRWIRLMYCYPDKITDELIEVIAKNDKICKYVDMPIQHISEDVLERMHRHGGAAVIRSAVERLRKGVPGITLRTTVMVGFPGEKERDFAELVRFVKEAKFERLGAFAYSREEGTPAYSMDRQIPKKTKEARLDSLMRAQMDVAEEVNAAMAGQTVTVLCEGYDPVSERWFGRTDRHAPEIDGLVWFTSRRKCKEGEFVSVRIEEAVDYDLIGKEVRS
ncbi:MAG: 30S ribosomal protein S12 methylthiotransferase RimO [Clostridia bacterium]|nr:30S ribosomal protein S12 methylthiotransferase RimO [Clostridia bacterium]